MPTLTQTRSSASRIATWWRRGTVVGAWLLLALVLLHLGWRETRRAVAPAKDQPLSSATTSVFLDRVLPLEATSKLHLQAKKHPAPIFIERRHLTSAAPPLRSELGTWLGAMQDQHLGRSLTWSTSEGCVELPLTNFDKSTGSVPSPGLATLRLRYLRSEQGIWDQIGPYSFTFHGN